MHLKGPSWSFHSIIFGLKWRVHQFGKVHTRAFHSGKDSKYRPFVKDKPKVSSVTIVVERRRRRALSDRLDEAEQLFLESNICQRCFVWIICAKGFLPRELLGSFPVWPIQGIYDIQRVGTLFEKRNARGLLCFLDTKALDIEYKYLSRDSVYETYSKTTIRDFPKSRHTVRWAPGVCANWTTGKARFDGARSPSHDIALFFGYGYTFWCLSVR